MINSPILSKSIGFYSKEPSVGSKWLPIDKNDVLDMTSYARDTLTCKRWIDNKKDAFTNHCLSQHPMKISIDNWVSKWSGRDGEFEFEDIEKLRQNVDFKRAGSLKYDMKVTIERIT